MMGDLSEKAVDADLASVRFRVGESRGHWRKVSYAFPILIVAVSAVDQDGTDTEYFFRVELTGFPGMAPEVKIWDLAANTPLPENERPKGSNRVIQAFKCWGNELSVYRPWDRHGRLHNNWTSTHPDLAWHPKRDLTFILEDLHGLLTSNAAKHRNRPAA